ncbi:Putative lipoprotein [Pseudomonas marincola]|uniref:Putative lipoprotein n=1 Tax=Pseudomonas marincola TaxID=437900 RepID=A0A653E198_9PSED|nr:hypothetical protein [Pseudomonas marincola]CAE6953979.1 Putative lipoprotein [Pseudomonas marincola]
MNRFYSAVAALLCAAFILSACATVAGGMVGGGVGRMAGDEQAGRMIGAGIGMMIDISD